MSGFSPVKKHANKFSYTPRYYDPEKEARDQRRAELHGTKRNEDMQGEYAPGQYLRTQREARAARRESRASQNEGRTWKMVIGMAVMLLIIAILYPRLAGLFVDMHKAAVIEKSAVEQLYVSTDELDQGGIDDVEWSEMPFTVVPNDYQPE